MQLHEFFCGAETSTKQLRNIYCAVCDGISLGYLTTFLRAEICRYVIHTEIHKHISDWLLLFLHYEVYHCKCSATYSKKWKESVTVKARQVTRPPVWTCLTVKQILKTGANSNFQPYWSIFGHLSFTNCKDHCWERYVLQYMVNSFLRVCLQKIMSLVVGGKGRAD
jgi:hypothetical protein